MRLESKASETLHEYVRSDPMFKIHQSFIEAGGKQITFEYQGLPCIYFERFPNNAYARISENPKAKLTLTDSQEQYFSWVNDHIPQHKETFGSMEEMRGCWVGVDGGIHCDMAMTVTRLLNSLDACETERNHFQGQETARTEKEIGNGKAQ